ncbi:MAG: guanylate kinase [Clostridia bacterium]|nr:guanylate kinase [Clostridia bacterium]
MVPGLLLVISGPSGAGKGTLCQALREEMPEIVYSISATTRQPRPGEADGKNYYFVDKEKFQEMIAAGAFLEWALVYDNFYGTPRRPVEEALAAGKDIILEIDTQGAAQIKKSFPEGVFIFILPPSLAELEQRIRKRGTETAEVVARRLQAARAEIAALHNYDYVIVNDKVEEAVKRLKAIIIAEKCRPQRLNLKLEG